MVPRRRCCGIIDEFPVCSRFIPEQGEDLTSVTLQLEELEAIKLKDIRNLDQNECAQVMGLSRQTFQRLLLSARQKIASALVEGRIILIQGGNFMLKNRVFECLSCGNIWEVEPCTAGGKHGYEIACPKCAGINKAKLENGQRHMCGGGHHGNGHRHGGGCCGGHR